jgi:hypothetical protein
MIAHKGRIESMSVRGNVRYSAELESEARRLIAEH